MTCTNCHKSIREESVAFLLYLTNWNEGWITICPKCSSYKKYRELRKPIAYGQFLGEGRKLLIPKED